MQRSISLVAGLAIALMAGLTHEPSASAQATQAINPADFSISITNPLFPASLTGLKVFEGEEDDDGDIIKTRLESRLLPATRVIMGVTVAIIEEKEYEDGELIEVALDYVAQHRDGSVYYFGEDVDFFEDGKLVDHHGSWIAGQGVNLPGILMPAQPQLNQTIQTEYAPGVAEDMVTFLLIGENVRTKAGNYSGCVMTLDFTPLEPGVKENKWYCPGIGLARDQSEDSFKELVSIATPASAAALAAAAAPRTTTAPVSAPASAAPPAAAPQAVAPAAAPVRPPSTGNAGLATGANTAPPLVTGGLLAVAGAALTIATARQARQRSKQ